MFRVVANPETRFERDFREVHGHRPGHYRVVDAPAPRKPAVFTALGGIILIVVIGVPLLFVGVGALGLLVLALVQFWKTLFGIA